MKRLAMAATLVLVLSAKAWAGEVPTMGVVVQQPPPQSTSIVTTVLLTILGLVGR